MSEATTAAEMPPPKASALAPATETGALGIYQLKRIWSRAAAGRQGHFHPRSVRERHIEALVIHACGLGLEQAAIYLGREMPSFEAFEQWIVATTGGVAPERVARINAAVAGGAIPGETARMLAAIEAGPPVLSVADLAHWDEHGYVVLHDAVPAAVREAAAHALWERVAAHPDDPETWYRRGGQGDSQANSQETSQETKQGIMVQYFQHPAFEAGRRSPRIQKAFAQLHGTADLWSTTDRVGFNPPEREGFAFPGPHLHWDVSLKMPIPLATGGILYLTDTPPEQGAFTLVPGFQRWGEAWLRALPPGADPRRQDLHALGPRPIGGRAGDLVIWHQALPHGASPNRGTRPRLVQYINMFPTHYEEQEAWI